MKILCLYNNPCALKLFDWIKEQENDCVLWNKPLDEVWCREERFDLAVSYTYSFIIDEKVLNALNNNVVNLHTSFLPWNRGVDPNMWSILEGTPRGVTLHYINSELDKGEIIYQELVDIVEPKTATLKSTYDELDNYAMQVFKKAFKYYEYWPEMKKCAIGKGTYHTDKQGLFLRECINDYDESIEEFKKNYFERKQKSDIKK